MFGDIPKNCPCWCESQLSNSKKLWEGEVVPWFSDKPSQSYLLDHVSKIAHFSWNNLPILRCPAQLVWETMLSMKYCPVAHLFITKMRTQTGKMTKTCWAVSDISQLYRGSWRIRMGYATGLQDYSWCEFCPRFRPVLLTGEGLGSGYHPVNNGKHAELWKKSAIGLYGPVCIWNVFEKTNASCQLLQQLPPQVSADSPMNHHFPN